MKNASILGFVVIGLMASGCASTGADNTTTLKRGNSEFVQMSGGFGEVHKYSGLQCPNVLDDMQFEKSHMYNPEGTDVSCGWLQGADRRYVTIYATRRPNAKFKDDWKQTLAVVNQVETPRGLSYDSEKSTSCTLAGLINVAAAMNKGEAKSGGVFTLETGVFTSEETTSVVTYHPAAGGWMLKVRSTRPTGAGHADETHYLEMCNEASEMTQEQSANITRAGWE